MIVKNESKVIERCLDSVKGTIDYWVIVDTGSTDGTQEIIRKFMRDVPGELHERPWVNFGHNRTEALKLARDKADYLLFIDADEVLEINQPIDKSTLQGDGYLIAVRISDNENISLQRGFLASTCLDWSWKNVLHERLATPEGKEVFNFLSGVTISAVSKDGNRSQDPQKYLKDALLLEKALVDEPENADYVYYLAQSYLNAGELQLALKNYERRGQMQGWDQATFWSVYYAGVLREQLGMPSETFVKNYSDAFRLRPSRAEPLYRLANYFYHTDNFILSYIVSRTALAIPVPGDLIYVEHSIYEYALPFLFANAAFQIGQHKEALVIYQKLLESGNVSEQFKEQVRKNLLLLKERMNRPLA